MCGKKAPKETAGSSDELTHFTVGAAPCGPLHSKCSPGDRTERPSPHTLATRGGTLTRHSPAIFGSSKDAT